MEINKELVDKIKEISKNKWFINRYFLLSCLNTDVIDVNDLFNEDTFNKICFKSEYITFSKFKYFEIDDEINDDTNKPEKWLILGGTELSFRLPSNISIDRNLNYPLIDEEEINNLLNQKYYIDDEKLKGLLLTKIENEYNKQVKELNNLLK